MDCRAGAGHSGGLIKRPAATTFLNIIFFVDRAGRIPPNLAMSQHFCRNFSDVNIIARKSRSESDRTMRRRRVNEAFDATRTPA
jgi:hypothetical protein